jgi:hypothetical protein
LHFSQNQGSSPRALEPSYLRNDEKYRSSHLRQHSARTWRRLALGRIVAVKRFLLRQLHIQATPKLYLPEFTGLNNCDQGASWARPAFFTGWRDWPGFLQNTANAGGHSALD